MNCASSYRSVHALSSKNRRPGRPGRALWTRRIQNPLLRILLAGLLSAVGAPLVAQSPQLYQRETAKPLFDVLDDAEFAITDRNFRVTGRLHIGKAIRERGNTGFPEYEVILFCNLGYAQQMLSLNPEYVNLCPAKVTVREAGRSVVIAATLLPVDSDDRGLNELMQTVNALLREIVDYAAREWSPSIDANASVRR